MEGERFMKNILTSAAIVTALFCGAAIAQDTTPSSTNPSAATPQTQAATPSTQPTHVAKIAPGSVIPVQLTKTVDAKKVKTGDESECRDASDAGSNALNATDTRSQNCAWQRHSGATHENRRRQEGEDWRRSHRKSYARHEDDQRRDTCSQGCEGRGTCDPSAGTQQGPERVAGRNRIRSHRDEGWRDANADVDSGNHRTAEQQREFFLGK